MCQLIWSRRLPPSFCQIKNLKISHLASPVCFAVSLWRRLRLSGSGSISSGPVISRMSLSSVGLIVKTGGGELGVINRLNNIGISLMLGVVNYWNLRLLLRAEKNEEKKKDLWSDYKLDFFIFFWEDKRRII